uniref:Alpha/beta hydrolase fold-3 domain-containing protein n=2 Tax=Parascaris univalens TaxID=6257 RepID=A0A915ASR2_PARUN
RSCQSSTLLGASRSTGLLASSSVNMFSMILSERVILAEFLSMFPSLANLRICLQVISVEQPIGEKVLFVSAMVLAVFLLVTAFLIALVSILYIPLPDGICDRLKLQFVEFLLRVSNEYFGRMVGAIFGPSVWNKLTRLIVAIAFLFKSRSPNWITVKNELIGATRVRVYYPAERKTDSLIIFIHGGGWATMRPGHYDNVIYMLIARLGVLVISIDYRLSPESPYPEPVNECEAVFHRLVNEEYKRFGIDPKRICVMGDSAGGNLSTVVAQRQLRKKLTLPKCQVLIYPVIHSFDLKSPSYQIYYKQLCGTSLLNPRLMARWYLLYLGIPAIPANIEKFLANCHLRRKDSDRLQELISHELLPTEFSEDHSEKQTDSAPDDELCRLFNKNGFNPDFAPILGKDLFGLPPAMIITAGYDILRDEGVLYAKRLQSFNVPVQWNHYPAAYHGVINMPSSMQRNQILDDIVHYLVMNL